MKVFAGVDCHKDSHTIVFLDEVGKALDRLVIEATAEEYKRALTFATTLAADREVVWGLEGSGGYGHAFAAFLAEAGASVYEVPALFTKRHRRHSSRRGKSDPIDAGAIAEALLRELERLPRFYADASHEELRILYDHRDSLVRERTQAMNRIRDAALRLKLKNLPNDLTRPKNVEKVVQEAEALRGRGPFVDALGQEITFAAAAIELYSRQIRELEHTLRPFVERRFLNVLAVYGASFITVAGLVGHAGDIRNCRNADAFAMRAAAAPIPCSSGRNQRLRLNPGGNRQLNRLLHTIAITQVSRRHALGRAYYDRKIAEGKTPRAALRCLKRQLATVVFYRLRDAYRISDTAGAVSLAA